MTLIELLKQMTESSTLKSMTAQIEQTLREFYEVKNTLFLELKASNRLNEHMALRLARAHKAITDCIAACHQPGCTRCEILKEALREPGAS